MDFIIVNGEITKKRRQDIILSFGMNQLLLPKNPGLGLEEFRFFMTTLKY